MDLRLREVTWIRLLSLLLWTILVMIKRAASQLIDVIEVRVFHVSGREPEREEQGQDIEGRTLLPPLSDELVLSRVWPLLHKRVNISLLWRLRRVNRAWKREVGTTIEWAALEMVRVDSPGLLRYLAVRHEPLPSLRERVEGELRAFAILLAESWMYPSDQTQTVVGRSLVDNSGPFVPGREEQNPTRVQHWSPEREWISDSSSSRGVVNSRCNERFLYREREESERSEEEELEAYASSMDSSMEVYYPRHWLRNQTR